MKKYRGVLREGVAMSDKYAAITAHRERVPVRMMCAALDVSERGFYDAVTRAPSAHALADERLRVHVRAVFAQRHCRYGAPRVHRDLTAGGQRVAKNELRD